MMTLNPSKVIFTENPHGYTLNGLPLSGVTGLIHDVLRLGVYPDADDFTREVAIPRAAEYGTSVHHAIEAWDTRGERVTVHPKTPRFIDRYHPETEWDVARELDTYIRHKRGYTAVANEYTVSDNIRYASNIDNVWLKDDTRGIWLVDTKTNNLKYYPGGESGLKEYLSWQLSVYAELFERQNPGIKVEGLAANWLRKDQGEFWVIDRKPGRLVDILLSTECFHDPATGGFDYFPPAEIGECLGRDLVPSYPTADSEGEGGALAKQVGRHIILGIYDTKARMDAAKAEYDTLTAGLREVMESNGVKSWDAGCFKATIAADSETTQFDTAAFKKAHPDLYKAFTKKSVRKGGFTIKLREKTA
ncbi:MAG: hypothetical protein LIP02_04145 [Bacteroidales bacterium]|nr:hypothetical protein [Bacteroidales bacterium]